MNCTILRRSLPLFLVAAQALTAQMTWHVSVNGAPAGTGSAASPFPSIQAGIDATNPGDTVLVGPGVYFENINFFGRAITVRSSTGAAATVIDGNNVSPCVTFFSNEIQTSVLRGFTLTHGSSVAGGGVHCSGASPRVEQCIVRGNTATNDGGGIFIWGGAPVFADCVIINNTSTLGGGGIACVAGSTATVLRCTFAGNTSNYGGGINSNGASPVFIDCICEGNTANNDGGGVLIFGGNPVLRRCDIRGNTADYGGGVSITSPTPVVLDRCSLVLNQGLVSGGAISAFSAIVVVTDCVIAGNTCNYYGAGLSCTGSSISVAHCTIHGNVSNLQGGGVHVYVGPDPTVVNSILWANLPDQASGQPGATVQITRSDVQGGYAGAGNINADPMLALPAAFDFHLLAASPCRNTGSNAAAAGIATDFEGNPRILGATVDMGADEYAPSYAGTGEDLLLETWIGGEGAAIAVKPAAAGQGFALRLTSPSSTFIGAIPVIAGTLYANGAPPAAIPGITYVHIDFANFVLLADGSAPPPFQVAALAPTGLGLGFAVPPGLAGFTFRLQGAVFSPLAANAAFATTGAHELVF